MLPARTSHAGSLLALSLLGSFLAPPAPAQAEIIRLADMLRGIEMTAAQCAAKPDTVWVTAYQRNFCIRYYMSTAGGSGRQPVVFLSGDKLGFYNRNTTSFEPRPQARDVDTDDLMRLAERISRMAGTTAIYLARPGIDGSSGDHFIRRRILELQAINVALDAIQRRYGFAGFHLVGQSGGATQVAGLLALRSDIGCAVPGAGELTLGHPQPPRERMLHFVDPSQAVQAIADKRSARLLVVTDPADEQVGAEQQFTFVRRLRQAGGRVEQFFVSATDPKHHDAAPYSIVAVSECVRGSGTADIASRLQAQAQRMLARAGAQETQTQAR